MGKYRVVRMNEVRYTDSERTLEQYLEQGFILAPAFESTKAVEVEAPPLEEDVKPKRTRKKATDEHA